MATSLTASCLVENSSEPVRVVGAPSTLTASLTARRCAIALAAGATLALAAAAAAGSATGPAEHDTTHVQGGKHKLSTALWASRGDRGILDAPRRWLAYSHDCFQRIMWMLSDRSAELQERYRSGTAPPREQAHDWPGPPGGYAPIPARWPDAGEDDEVREEPPRPRAREASPDRGDAPEWPGEGTPRCRRAGTVVEGGGWYVVRPGDTLWRIAQAHYGDGGAWRRILRANWRTVPDANCIYACQRIYIPPRWEEERPPARRPWSEPA